MPEAVSKLIVVSDFHFHNHPTFGGERTPDGTPIHEEIGDKRFPGVNARCRVLFAAVEWAIDYAAKRGISSMLALGDIFHTKGNVPFPVFNGATKVFADARRKGITIYALPGNHDYVGKMPNWSSLNSLYSLPNLDVTMFPLVRIIPAGPYTLAAAMIPYMPSHETLVKAIEKMAKEVRRMVSAGTATHTGLFLHTSMQGAVVGPHEYVMQEGLRHKDIPYEDFGIVMSGHYHKRQSIPWRGHKFHYCGALAQHNLGERAYTPGLAILTLGGDGAIGLTFYENKLSPRFAEVTLDKREELADLIERAREQDLLSPGEDTPQYVKVNWTGADYPDDLDIPHDRIVVERVPVSLIRPRIEFDMAKETPESLVSRYVEETSVDPKDNRALVEVGLEILKEAL